MYFLLFLSILIRPAVYSAANTSPANIIPKKMMISSVLRKLTLKHSAEGIRQSAERMSILIPRGSFGFPSLPKSISPIKPSNNSSTKTSTKRSKGTLSFVEHFENLLVCGIDFLICGEHLIVNSLVGLVGFKSLFSINKLVCFCD